MKKKNINRFEQKDLQEYEKARLGISRPLLQVLTRANSTNV